jgi:hypothetical protein
MVAAFHGSQPFFAALSVAILTTRGAQLRGERDGMSFFVASNNDRGADLGGLQGADQRCQSLARSVGAGDRTWRAT